MAKSLAKEVKDMIEKRKKAKEDAELEAMAQY